MTIVLWKLLFTWCEADSSLFALVISFLCSAVIVTFSTLSRLMPIFFLCLFFRSQGQMGGRRWVWRVIPLHLSINLETISSIPYRMSKPRWAEDESIIFFRRLSLEFPSKHINTSCAIIFYCPSSLSVDGGPREWVNAVEWVVFYAKEKLYLRTTGCDRILSLSLRSLCMGSDGACARDLLSNRKWDT